MNQPVTPDKILQTGLAFWPAEDAAERDRAAASSPSWPTARERSRTRLA